jgi:trans-aconitate 2-methyltransferase
MRSRLKKTEWDAVEYTRISGLQQAMADEVLSLLNLRGAEQVLDVGCGNGNITAAIARRVPRGSVVGVDPSSEMIELAERDFASSNLRFETGDARHLRFRDDFDVVVSFNALHWIPEPEQDDALRSICRAMKPDATAQLRLVPEGPRKSLENVIEETCHELRWSQYFQGHRDPYLHITPEQYAAAAERNGLCVNEIRTEDKAWDFGSRDAFAAFGEVTFIAWTQHLPEKIRLQFVNDVLDRYRTVAGERTGEENTFKFYQMDVSLSRR